MIGSKEFYPVDMMVAPTQSLRKTSGTASEPEKPGEEELVSMEEVEEKEPAEGSKPAWRKTPRRAAAK